eukprot:1396721-Lingulodinium_polyedra.AAC.1
MLLPHELFAYLSRWPAQFFERVRGSSEDACIRFWKGCRSQEWYRAHPGRSCIDADSSRVIPIRLYGDDATYHQGKSALVLTWSSASCTNLGSWLSRHLITIVPLEHSIDGITIEAVHRVVQWSMHVLLEGRWPARDHNGEPWPVDSWRWKLGKDMTPLANNYIGALAQVVGDWKWLKENFKLQHSYASRFCCHHCLAVKQGAGPPFNDSRDCVEHRQTVRTH